MGTCSYTWNEWDKERHESVKKSCRRETWKSSDELCIFHDPLPEKDVNLFKEMLKRLMEAEIEELNFDGYFFPEGWDFLQAKDLKLTQIL